MAQSQSANPALQSIPVGQIAQQVNALVKLPPLQQLQPNQPMGAAGGQVNPQARQAPPCGSRLGALLEVSVAGVQKRALKYGVSPRPFTEAGARVKRMISALGNFDYIPIG